ncbi:MAG: DUF4197 domain-containing protein [Bacteroidia bacterium]|nr:DUF4197 domain-containing protein [Bacteroidia bacterium]
MKQIHLTTALGAFLLLSAFVFAPAQNDKMVAGIKDALNVGTKNAVAAGSKLNGYYGNPKIKIPFPPEVQQVEKELRKVGMGKKVDEFVVGMNRAAEGAAKEATPVFVDAIKKMTVTDAVGLVKGGDNSITNYFKKKSDAELVQKFTPAVSKSLTNVQAAKSWNELAAVYNKIPFVKKTNFDITTYTTRKAVDGLYTLIADEESKIRKDPAARVTSTLKDIFGKVVGP